MRARAWTSIVLLSPFGAAALLSQPTVAESSLVDLALDTLGWLLFVAGAFFRWWATLYVGGRKSRVLAVEGPYSICRNPLYVGTFLITLSIVFIAHSAVFGLGVLLASVYYLGLTIPAEEHNLRAKFGAAYDEYCRQTPRLWPSWRRFRSSSSIDTNLIGLRSEFRRMCVWVWVPAITEIVVHLHAQAPWLHRLHLP